MDEIRTTTNGGRAKDDDDGTDDGQRADARTEEEEEEEEEEAEEAEEEAAVAASRSVAGTSCGSRSSSCRVQEGCRSVMRSISGCRDRVDNTCRVRSCGKKRETRAKPWETGTLT